MCGYVGVCVCGFMSIAAVYVCIFTMCVWSVCVCVCSNKDEGVLLSKVGPVCVSFINEQFFTRECRMWGIIMKQSSKLAFSYNSWCGGCYGI